MLVLAKVMVCCVAVGPGTLRNTSASGLSERPESGEPKPVSAAVATEVPEEMVRVPVAGPVAVGAWTIWMKQEALEARGPLHAGPPLEAGLMMKSPVTVGAERFAVVGVRLVRVNSVGALELWIATGPKSCWVGVRTRPVSGRPLPVRAGV